ncbi:MAG TPA: DUF1080 domain-containing protein [Fimbriiglobus sp.]|nr:DUF1080 domain-containing protein [Fimbriiglobus sp.]
MPKVIRFAGLLLAAGLVCGTAAADEKKPNTLTPKEAAEGWLMLFDGKTTFGWTVKDAPSAPKSDLAVKDGVLVFKGTASTVCFKTRFRYFELTGEYRTVTKGSTFGVKITTDMFGQENGGESYWDHLIPLAGCQWKAFSVYSVPNRFSIVSQDPAKPGVSGGGVGDGVLKVEFTLPESDAGRIELRNLKLRPLSMTPLLNGKDLSGWKVFQDPKRSKSKFEVTPAGELHLTNGPGDLQTEKKYADFVLQLECKVNGKNLNSGIFFRCVQDQYQNGYEAQIDNGYKNNDRTKPTDHGTGAIYRRTNARKVVSNDNEWFTMTVVADGPHISTWVNGYQTTDWTDKRKPAENPRQGLRLAAGHISIQGHDRTTDILFRNIRIAELKK